MMLYKQFFALLILGIILVAPVSVLAVACPNGNSDCRNTPATPVCSNRECVSGADWFKNIITNFLNIVIWPIFIALSIIMFIWAGILFFNSHGDPTKAADARKAVIYAIVGIVVGLLGYVIVGVLRGALGL